jgi:hypothetical protein
VAEVQHAAQSRLAFVGRDDIGLDAARLGHDGGDGDFVAREERWQRARNLIEERRACNHPVLHNFVQAGAKLAPRQRGQHRWIGDNEAWGVECADQVLAEWVIDPDFAADGAVYLRHDCRRNLHETHTAKIGGSGESHEITDHAATDGDDHR